MTDELRNVGASVRARLLNLAKKEGVDFQLLLTRYTLERLLYRLSASAHRDEFVLKGAMLYAIWIDNPFRYTRDLDLLAQGEQDAAKAASVFKDILSTKVPDDGLIFDVEKMQAEPIRENVSYGGIRIETTASLAGARVPVRVDIGFGDDVWSGPIMADYPVLLDHPEPRLQVYPRDAVIAEKFEAMVTLGLTNSRMKDFHDIAMLAKRFAFEGPRLAATIAATFARRRTALPLEAPLALTDAFLDRTETRALWNAFVIRESITRELSNLNQISNLLRKFLLPPTEAAAKGIPFNSNWQNGGPWIER